MPQEVVQLPSPARGLYPAGEAELDALRRLVPPEHRPFVQLGPDGSIDAARLRQVAEDHPDTADLYALAAAGPRIEVRSGTKACAAGACHDFTYETLEQARQVAKRYGVTGPIVQSLFLGLFDPRGTGGVVYYAAPQVGAPTAEIDRTLRHELFGHAALYLKGRPWEHPDRPGAAGAPNAFFLALEARPIHPPLAYGEPPPGLGPRAGRVK